MEDPADTVVPLRPGFDVQLRGFNRTQVGEHIEQLETQLELITMDRNEAAQLNVDLRRLYDETRQELEQAEQRLKRIETSDTGLPAASQRVQNMLDSAEEEVQVLRDRAKRQAEILRGTAETEARSLLDEAQQHTAELKAECTELLAEVETQRARLREETAQSAYELGEQEKRLRHQVRAEYKRVMALAQDESDAMIADTQRRCGQIDAETEALRLDALEDINRRRTEVEELRLSVLQSLERVREVIGTTSSTLLEPGIPAQSNGSGEKNHVQVPGPREQFDTFTIPLTPGRNGHRRADKKLANSRNSRRN